MRFITYFFILMAICASVSASNYKHRDGFVFEPWTDLPLEQIRKKMKDIKKSGASHVTFLVFLCQKGITSNYPTECNDFDHSVRTRLAWGEIARSEGLSFDLTPFPYSQEEDGSWRWRGEFDPSNLDLWFENYEKKIAELTKVAYEHGALYQVVGTELHSLHKYTSHWISMAKRLRKVTTRPLVMNVSWFEIPHRFWKAFDIIGISAYYPLAPTKSASVFTMKLFWKAAKAKIKLLSKLYGKPFQFSEVGYPSANGGAIIPSNFDYNNRKVDLEEQRRCFQAFRETWQNDRSLVRAIIWATAVPDKSVNMSQDKTYDPFNKPAMNEIQRFFNARKALR